MAPKLPCGAQLLKFIMIGFNLVIWVMSGVLIGVSAWLAADPTAKERFGIASDGNNSLWYAATWTMVAVGSVIFIVSFLGCLGAMLDNPGLLIAYAVILGVMLLVQVIGGILAAVFSNQIRYNLMENMERQVQTKYMDDNIRDTLHLSWDRFHQKELCCGARGVKDWPTSQFYKVNNGTKPVPWTCCKYQAGDHWEDGKPPSNLPQCYNEARKIQNGSSVDILNNIYEVGCFQSLMDWLKYNMDAIMGIAFGVGLIQLTAIVLAIFLANAFRDSD